MKKYRICIYMVWIVFLSCLTAAGAPVKKDNVIDEADNYFNRNMFDEAVVLYKNFLKDNPDDLKARLNYARALAGNKLYERAVAEYKKIILAQPHSKEALGELAGILRDTGSRSEAIDIYMKLLSMDPQDEGLRLSLAQIYYDAQEYTKAAVEYEKILIKNSGNAKALLGLGESFYEISRYEKAEDYFSKAIKVAAQDPRGYFGLGRIYLKTGQYGLAIEEFNRAGKLSLDDDFNILHHLAVAYVKNSEYEKAVAEYEKILSFFPDNDKIRFELASAYLNIAAYKETIVVLKPVKEEERFVYQKYFLLAYAYMAQGDYADFYNCLKKIKIVVAIFISLAVGLVFVALSTIGLLFLSAYLMGKKIKDKSILYSHVKWTLNEAFAVCALLFLLPFFFGVLLGGVFYGNIFLVFVPSQNIASHGVQLTIFAQVVSVILICGLVFLLVVKKHKNTLSDLGFNKIGFFKILKFTFFSAGAIMGFSFIYFYLFYLFSGKPPQTQYISEIIATAKDMKQLIPLFVFVAFIGPIAEEVIFRGFIFSSLRRNCGFYGAALINAVIFGSFHFQLSLFLPLAFMGFIFAWLLERTKSIFPSILMHLVWNCMSFSSIFFR